MLWLLWLYQNEVLLGGEGGTVSTDEVIQDMERLMAAWLYRI